MSRGSSYVLIYLLGVMGSAHATLVKDSIQKSPVSGRMVYPPTFSPQQLSSPVQKRMLVLKKNKQHEDIFVNVGNCWQDRPRRIALQRTMEFSLAELKRRVSYP